MRIVVLGVFPAPCANRYAQCRSPPALNSRPSQNWTDVSPLLRHSATLFAHFAAVPDMRGTLRPRRHADQTGSVHRIPKVHFDKRVFAELTSLRFIEGHRHVVVLGPVGVGKTFLACALGQLACRHGYNVLFRRADELLRRLRQSRMDNSREALMTELCTIDVLIIDDFALEPMSREESRDIYELFVERTGRASTIVTSNRDTAEWIQMFDEVLLAQSAVDRFTNAAYDLVVEGESYRPRQKPKVASDDPPPAAPVTKAPGPPKRRKRR